jgi:hypothetical protein
MKRQQQGLLAVVAVVVLAGAALAAWKFFGTSRPKADADFMTVARFVGTSDYRQLSEAQKRPYMKTLRANMPALIQAMQQGKLARRDYDEAYLNVWMERQLDHMGNYYKLPPDRRAPYLLEEATRKAKASKGSAEEPRPDPKVEDDFIDARVNGWSPEEQSKWQEYRKAAKAAKEKAKSKDPGTAAQ